MQNLCEPYVGTTAQQPQAQAGDPQAQWAEYYRSLGYAYYGQQGQQNPAASGQTPQPPTTTAAPNGEQKVMICLC